MRIDKFTQKMQEALQAAQDRLAVEFERRPKDQGVRPLRRTIQKEILDPLSIDILEGKVREGQTVKIDAKNGALAFNTR